MKKLNFIYKKKKEKMNYIKKNKNKMKIIFTKNLFKVIDLLQQEELDL